MSEPWLTIVTAVRDDLEGLQRTLASVSSQDLSGVEVLVVDSSADADAVREVSEGIASVSWMQPQGIYPAMNAGLDSAGGEYVHFLNAGDAFHGSDVLAKVRQVVWSNPAWMFGPVDMIGPSGERITTPYWDYQGEKAHLFARGLFPQHQGTFARRELPRDLGGFSAGYQVAADYALFLKMSQIADPVELDFVIADFYEGGASSSQWKLSFREFHRARGEVFAPRGADRWRERWDSAVHFARVWAYRDVVEPLKRRARR